MAPSPQQPVIMEGAAKHEYGSSGEGITQEGPVTEPLATDWSRNSHMAQVEPIRMLPPFFLFTFNSNYTEMLSLKNVNPICFHSHPNLSPSSPFCKHLNTVWNICEKHTHRHIYYYLEVLFSFLFMLEWYHTVCLILQTTFLIYQDVLRVYVSTYFILF